MIQFSFRVFDEKGDLLYSTTIKDKRITKVGRAKLQMRADIEYQREMSSIKGWKFELYEDETLILTEVGE